MFGSGKRIKEFISLIDSVASSGPICVLSQIPRDDVGKLAESINRLIERLRGRIAELENEEGRIRGILDSMVEGVVAVDQDMRIQTANPAAEKMFDIALSNAKGRFFLEVVQNSDIAGLVAEVQKREVVLSRELNLFLPFQRILRVNASPISESGKPGGCLLVIHDVTKMRELETMRRDFVANVSHELKTPLTSIKGFVETLLEGALEDKDNSRKFLKIIQDHTDRLNNLINDLLDLSSIESEKITLKKEDFDFRLLLEEVINGFSSQVKKRRLQIINELSAPLVVRADRNRIEQVVTNLLDNSIKFNRENGTIRVYSQDTVDLIRVWVEDTGAGIPAKDIPMIFERFYRVDKARSRELGGTGLGLSIVKHIAELHGGSVGVESIEGLGSKFWFTIPKLNP